MFITISTLSDDVVDHIVTVDKSKWEFTESFLRELYHSYDPNIHNVYGRVPGDIWVLLIEDSYHWLTNVSQLRGFDSFEVQIRLKVHVDQLETSDILGIWDGYRGYLTPPVNTDEDKENIQSKSRLNWNQYISGEKPLLRLIKEDGNTVLCPLELFKANIQSQLFKHGRSIFETYLVIGGDGIILTEEMWFEHILSVNPPRLLHSWFYRIIRTEWNWREDLAVMPTGAMKAMQAYIADLKKYSKDVNFRHNLKQDYDYEAQTFGIREGPYFTNRQASYCLMVRSHATHGLPLLTMLLHNLKNQQKPKEMFVECSLIPPLENTFRDPSFLPRIPSPKTTSLFKRATRQHGKLKKAMSSSSRV